jgi:NAD(P)-dependent dehydrogenase (short-subunit alcohol dehydrogenase family)
MVSPPDAARAVIVTGGLGGIGMATGLAFARLGDRVLLLDRSAGDVSIVDALEAAGASDALTLACDVADEAAIEDAVARGIARFGRLDVIVNVAGQMIYTPIDQLSAADWRSLLDVNLIGAALLIRQAFRHMTPGGAIVNIASVHARRTSRLVAPYAASKAALVSLTRSAAIEGKPLGIRCNAILPGAIDTAMLRDSPNLRSGAEVLDPADVGQPEDIAALAVFLASADARFITGEDVVADGGRMGRL